MSYRIAYQPGAQKQLGRLPAAMRARIAAAIGALADDPRPHGCKKLQNRTNQYRIRISDYRVIYSIYDAIVTVEVVDIDHRKDIYR